MTTLPKYMIPCQIIGIDHIPKTPSGKIDRRLLTEMAGKSSQTHHSQQDREVPPTPTKQH